MPLIDLRPDNFTPTSRTPWGGTRIAAEYKGLGDGRVVGESWELSVEPDFPSVTREGERLADVIARAPEANLGREAARGSTGLLVKLLDTADALSVQIHPADDYAGLAQDESGKPECWYVARRDEGAGVYLGLSPDATREAVRDALAQAADVSALLRFVPVEVGDFLLIDAGTAHAIGRGLTLVEPQRVIPGRRGVTYRYWDWNRRYDAEGRLDANGSPRALHVEHALAVTRWDAPRGADLLRAARVRAGEPPLDAPARVEPLCGRSGPAVSDALEVARLSGSGEVPLPRWGALVGLTVLEGSVTVEGARVGRGETAAIPAAMGGAVARCEGAHAVLSSVY
ncbi:MAG: type I phosphomannose isomerase catalytic subunit [Polyangiales bacterium]